jgi:transcriptional regulator with XRE-family HTH domain
MAQRSLGHIHRAIRVRLGLRQGDVSKTSGVSRQKISRLERDLLADLAWSDLQASFAALDARLDGRVSWHGAALDRLLDEGHARLAGHVVRLLNGLGWTTHVEVSFSEYGERGSIDILAWHAGQRMLLVVEIKTELSSIDGLLRPLDIKVRLAPKLARERFGWHAKAVGRIVVLPEDSSARRAVSRLEPILGVALPARSHDVRRWLAHPHGPIAGLWFLSDDRTVSTTRNPSAVRRVRRRRSSPSERDLPR